MKYPLLKKKIPAYTLTEILVVLVIIGILVLLALPNRVILQHTMTQIALNR